MLHIKTNPSGIDIYIQRLQTELYNRMSVLWPGVIHESYGRCSRNFVNGKYIAEVYNPGEGMVVSPNKTFIFSDETGGIKILITDTTEAAALAKLEAMLEPLSLPHYSLINTISNYAAPGENEYVDVLWNDRSDIVSFFGIDPELSNMTQRNTGVHLIVFCNLKKLKPSIGGRADEEIRTEYMNTIGKVLYGFHFRTLVSGMENVLKEYPGSIDKMRKTDMHPIYSFRINFTLSYNQNFSTQLKLN